ncbi:hypothetical protein MF672_019005 [Actinomadura sp. ATCC 31491]|uniref:Peptidylprolyl isomerase n=1 Tax=Actinomadura luzonensis TaxID=2805427 RepID=A0ABT0FUM9_9ACTN|nr:hypothetical protein [Actinomadura luzonensis]MCK2215868.1 hypothetical protein [Actinomadura luzonensis]
MSQRKVKRRRAELRREEAKRQAQHKRAVRRFVYVSVALVALVAVGTGVLVVTSLGKAPQTAAPAATASPPASPSR